jgi:hypothetical protein
MAFTSSDWASPYVKAKVIQSATRARDLGWYFDDEVSMCHHVALIAQTCFYNLRRLRSVRRLLCQDITAQLVLAFILSRLDFCNAVLTGLPAATLRPLYRAMNAAVRTFLGL